MSWERFMASGSLQWSCLSSQELRGSTRRGSIKSKPFRSEVSKAFSVVSLSVCPYVPELSASAQAELGSFNVASPGPCSHSPLVSAWLLLCLSCCSLLPLSPPPLSLPSSCHLPLCLHSLEPRVVCGLCEASVTCLPPCLSPDC